MIFVSFRYPWAPSCIFYLVAFSSSIHPVPESGVLGSWTVLGRLVLDGVGSLGPMALAAVGSHGWPWLAIAGFGMVMARHGWACRAWPLMAAHGPAGPAMASHCHPWPRQGQIANYPWPECQFPAKFLGQFPIQFSGVCIFEQSCRELIISAP